MLATEYAEYYGIKAQRADESDVAFRSRVAIRLWGLGKIVKAREAYRDKRYKRPHPTAR